MLTCSCDYNDSGWYYYTPNDFTVFTQKRRKRCCSCGKFLNFGNQSIEFGRYRQPISDIEERICGDEIKMASWFMCEGCGEIFLNLADLGYCHHLGCDVGEDLKEYWCMTGFIPANNSLNTDRHIAPAG